MPRSYSITVLVSEYGQSPKAITIGTPLVEMLYFQGRKKGGKKLKARVIVKG